MYAEPIAYRLKILEEKYKEQVVKLIKHGWSDNSIAIQVGSDKLTVKRFRKKYLEGIDTVQNEGSMIKHGLIA